MSLETPWQGTETAARGRTGARVSTRGFNERPGSPRQRTWRWTFPEPLGARSLRPLPALDLAGFPEAHCVQSFVYLEPAPGLLERGLERVLGVAPPAGFALEAVARPRGAGGEAERRVIVEAADAPVPPPSGVSRAPLARRAPVAARRAGRRPLLDAIEARNRVGQT
jgi:hypothetical protein